MEKKGVLKEDIIIEREQKMLYGKLANTVVKNLNRRYINARHASSKEQALSMVMDMVTEGATMGTADSTTLLHVGVLSEIRKRGRSEIINPFIRDEEGHLLIDEEERSKLERKLAKAEGIRVTSCSSSLAASSPQLQVKGRERRAKRWAVLG
jgi:hypothetical protein